MSSLLWLGAVLASFPALQSAPGDAPPSSPSLPLSFEANQGQFPDAERFRVKRSDAVVAFHKDSVTHQRSDGGAPLTLEFLGANSTSRLRGAQPLEARSNYFRGSERGGFVTDVPHFGSLRYDELYDGIDLEWSIRDSRLKYTFHLEAGVDPSRVRLSYRGSQGLSVRPDGSLSVDTEYGSVLEEAPIAFQPGPFGNQAVACRFLLDGADTFGFEVSGHDPALPLVIDPFIDFSTYFGGDQYDAVYSVDTDAVGDIYVAGKTRAPNFPATDGSTVASFEFDAFAAKFTSEGDLVYATYLGGTGIDEAWGIDVAPDGRAVLAGHTTGFLPFVPKGGAIQDGLAGSMDGFALKLNATGNVVDWATYLGGNGIDRAWDVAVDDDGNAYVVGETHSYDFPLVNADQTQLKHMSSVYSLPGDISVTKIDSAGTQFVYSTYLGSSGFDLSYAIGVDDLGRAYVGGGCGYDDIGYTTGAADITFDGPGIYGEGFVVRYASNDGTTTLTRDYLTYVGGTTAPGSAEYPVSLAVGPDYSCYVAGYTTATDLPGVAGHYDETISGSSDCFVSRIAADGGSFLYNTYLGGPDGTDPSLPAASNTTEIPWGIALDEEGCAWITGVTGSEDFPVVEAGDPTPNGDRDAFVSALSADGNTLMFSTYLGGETSDVGHDVAADGQGGIIVVGEVDFTLNFPIHEAYDATHNSHGLDGFITKFNRSPATFIRGDANHDGLVNIADPALILDYVAGNVADTDQVNLDAADVDDSGTITVGDAIVLFSYFFSSGPPPAAPFPGFGPDPTTDELGSFVIN